MKKLSLVLSSHYLSNNTVVFSINKEEFKKYLTTINKFQNKEITSYSLEKKYSHVKNHQLLVAILKYFKDKSMVIFNPEDKIESISDFELMLLKSNLNIKLEGFEYEESLKFLKQNNILDIFLNQQLFVNIVYYYSEYSRSFGERVNIKNQQDKITDLKKVQEYIKKTLLFDEHKSENVYHYSKKGKVISFSYGKNQIYLEDNRVWLKEFFQRNQDKTSGFPYAQGKVFEKNFLELLEMAN